MLRLPQMIFFLFVINQFSYGLDIIEAELVQDFSENVTKEINVSNINVIRGVMAQDAVKAISEDALILNPLLFTKDQNICLRVTSRDATYTSANTYRIKKSATPIFIKLPYKSKHKNHILKLGKNDIGVLIHAGECNTPSSKYFLPVKQTKSTGTKDNKKVKELTILINAGDATSTRYVLYSGGKKFKQGKCKKFRKGKRTAYNYKCIIDDLPKSQANLFIELKRKVFSRSMGIIKLQLVNGNT